MPVNDNTPLVSQQAQATVTTEKKKLSKKQLIMIIAAAVFVIGLVVVLLVFLLRTDYAGAYAKAEEASASFEKFYSTSNSVSDLMTTDSSEFATDLGQEKTYYNDFKKAYLEIGQSSALKDKDIKEKYTAFKAQADSIVPKMDVYFETATPIHDFVIKAKKLSSTSATKWTDADVDDLVSSLVKSTNDKLVSFGKKFSEASKNLIKSVNNYKNSGKSSDYALYTQAKSDYSAAYSSSSKISDELGVMTSSDANKLTDLWKSLKTTISEKYKK